MRVTIIYGSPRKKGNTASLLSPFMDELKKKDTVIDYFDSQAASAGGHWQGKF